MEEADKLPQQETPSPPQTIPEPGVVQPKPESDTKPKMLVPLLVVLVFLLLGTTSFFAYKYFQTGTKNAPAPTPVAIDATPGSFPTPAVLISAEEGVFRHVLHNLQFRYPASLNLSLSDDANPAREHYYLFAGFIPKGGDPTAYSMLYFDITEEFASFDEYFATQGCNDKTAQQVVETTYQGFPAKRVFCPDLPLPTEYVVIQKNGLLYRLGANFGSSFDSFYSAEEQKTLYYQILETLEFLPETDTSSWLSYTRDKVPGSSLSGFKLKYPADWSLDETENENFYSLLLTVDNVSFKVDQANIGGGGCLYPGDPDRDGPYTRVGEYLELVFNNGTIWRLGPETHNNDPENEPITVCQRRSGEDEFSSITSIGATGIVFSGTADQVILEEIVQILSTIEFLD
jgi:hypothetical protein